MKRKATTRDGDDAPRRHNPPPSLYTKRQMRRTDETECKAVSGRSVHRRSSSFVLHRDVEEREEIRWGRMNRRVVGNVKVDFHLGRSLLASNLSKGHAGNCQMGASHECVEYEMTAFRSAFNPVFY